MYRITEEIESGEPTIFRHTLVAGSTGKGKTHFTKNLLRQFATDKRYPIENHQTGATEHSRLNVVILDPENEYSEMRDDNPDLEHNTELVEKLEREGIAVGGIDNLETFIPEIGNTNAPSTGESRNLTIPFSLVEHRPQLLMPYEPTEVTRGAIKNCIQAYFDEHAGSSATYEGFVQFLRDNADSESHSDAATTLRMEPGERACDELQIRLHTATYSITAQIPSQKSRTHSSVKAR